MQKKLSLPSELTIYTVGELRTQWLAWLDAAGTAKKKLNQACSVDAAAVSEVDGAGVQLLLSLSHSLARMQRTLALVNPSRPLIDACQALGVWGLLAADKPNGACA